MRVPSVVALVLLLLAAGCVRLAPALDPAASGAPAVDPLGGFPDPLAFGHDHSDLSLHHLSTPTMELLAREAFADPRWGLPVLGEMDVLGEDRLVIADFVGGFYLVDVTDPAAPVALHYQPDAGLDTDVKASKDGRLVFSGTQTLFVPPPPFLGIKVWDVSGPAPVLVGAAALEGGCHMLDVHEIAGKEYVFCAPNDATVRIFEVVRSPAAVALLPVGMYAPLGPPAPFEERGAEFTHDMTVQDDPLTGEPVMFVSFWDYGVRIVSLLDPANPVEVGSWQGVGSDVYSGHVHTTMATAIEGRRVVVTVPEWAAVPAVTFLDATDFGNVTVLGVWVAKAGGDFEDESRTYSTHNFQLANGHVYMAMYHGGVWVLDAATLDAVRAPKALGYYLPSEPRDGPLPAPSFLGGAPSVWDVVVKDGVVYATDIPSGLYALRFTGDALGDPAVTGFA